MKHGDSTFINMTGTKASRRVVLANITNTQKDKPWRRKDVELKGNHANPHLAGGEPVNEALVNLVLCRSDTGVLVGSFYGYGTVEL